MGRRRKSRRKVTYSPRKAAYVYGLRACPWCGKVSFSISLKEESIEEDGIIKDVKMVKCRCRKCGFSIEFMMPAIYDKPDAYSFVVDVVSYITEYLEPPKQTRFPVFSLETPES